MKPFTLSFFENTKDVSPEYRTFTISELSDFFSKPNVRDKKEGLLFSGAFFNGQRKKENVSSVCLLCLDFDHQVNLTLDMQPWIDIGCLFFLYTTFNHQQEKDGVAEDRFRVVIPLAEPLPAEQYVKLWEAAHWFTGEKIDRACKDPSRIFYTPAHQPGQPFVFRSHGSELLDATKFISDVETEKTRQSSQVSSVEFCQKTLTTTRDEASALDYLSRLSGWRADDYNTWLAVGANLKFLGGTGLELWNQWSKQSTKYEEGVCAAKWETLPVDQHGVAKLGSWANKDSPDSTKKVQSTTAEKPSDWYIPVSHLLNKQFKPMQWVVDQLLPEGLILLAGPPKSGKSFFALELATAIATGRAALGCLPVIPGRVLFLSVDDPSERRFQNRLRSVLGTDTEPLMDYSNELPGLPAHYFIEEWLKRNLDAKLVVVDILQNIRLPQIKGQGVYEGDYQALEELRKLASKYRVAILVLHHTRKMKSDDFLEEASGSFGLTGATDAVLVLRRKRGANIAELYATGRDMPEAEPLSLIWNDGWRMATENETVSPQQRKILEAIRTHTIKNYSDICRFTGLDHESVRVQIHRLKNRGLVAWVNVNTPHTKLIIKSVTPVTSVTAVTPVTAVTGVTGVTDVTVTDRNNTLLRCNGLINQQVADSVTNVTSVTPNEFHSNKVDFFI